MKIKYHYMVCNSSKIDKEKCKKINKKYCESFYKFFKNFVPSIKNDCTSDEYKGNIFVFWYDGIDNMPDIVKICYENLNNTTKHNVILIDKNNYYKYATIDSRIINMLNNKEISLTLFSDILRLNILSKYDAIWLDSTVFLYHDIPNEFLNSEFLTVFPGEKETIFRGINKFNFAPELHLQQSYFLLGKNKKVFYMWYSLLVNYLINETKLLRKFRPYYISYYVFEYLYVTNLDFKNIVDTRKINNINVEQIEGNNLKIYESINDDAFFDSTTFLYKLSYKFDFPIYINNELTLYGKLLKDKKII